MKDFPVWFSPDPSTTDPRYRSPRDDRPGRCSACGGSRSADWRPCGAPWRHRVAPSPCGCCRPLGLSPDIITAATWSPPRCSRSRCSRAPRAPRRPAGRGSARQPANSGCPATSASRTTDTGELGQAADVVEPLEPGATPLVAGLGVAQAAPDGRRWSASAISRTCVRSRRDAVRSPPRPRPRQRRRARRSDRRSRTPRRRAAPVLAGRLRVRRDHEAAAERDDAGLGASARSSRLAPPARSGPGSRLATITAGPVSSMPPSSRWRTVSRPPGTSTTQSAGRGCPPRRSRARPRRPRRHRCRTTGSRPRRVRARASRGARRDVDGELHVDAVGKASRG